MNNERNTIDPNPKHPKDYYGDRPPDSRRDIPSDSPETWQDRAEILERNLLVRGHLVRRVHWDGWIADDFVFGGPLFDPNLMVQSIISQMESTGTVGYSWAIVRFGQLVDAGGIGDARTMSESNPLTMTESTRMVSASLAKPICAVAIMKLIDEGELSLNDEAHPFIEDEFPDVHASVEDVTIRHLLTHTAGITASGGGANFGDVLQQPTSFPPGTSASYHNNHYWFLAYVVQGITGEVYADYAIDNVLLPMTITDVNGQVDDVPCLYYGASSTSNGFAWGDFSSGLLGPYGWYATAIDWAKFMTYFRYDQVLEKASRLTMLNAPETYFGFRHWTGQPRGTYYGHGGDFYNNGRAFHGGIMGFPDMVDAVLLTNSNDGADPESVLIQAYHDAYA
jgi:CubicO group peptidase (beta-lactamase class C family)